MNQFGHLYNEGTKALRTREKPSSKKRGPNRIYRKAGRGAREGRGVWEEK